MNKNEKMRQQNGKNSTFYSSCKMQQRMKKNTFFYDLSLKNKY